MIASLKEEIARLKAVHTDKSDLLANNLVEIRRMGAEVDRLQNANMHLGAQAQAYQTELAQINSEFVMAMRSGYMPDGTTIRDAMEKLLNVKAIEDEAAAKDLRIARLEAYVENLQRKLDYVPAAEKPPGQNSGDCDGESN